MVYLVRSAVNILLINLLILASFCWLPLILCWLSFGIEPVFHFFSVYGQREERDLSEPRVENRKGAQVCFSFCFCFF